VIVLTTPPSIAPGDDQCDHQPEPEAEQGRDHIAGIKPALRQ
jgi:hypothetical protein